MEPPMHLNIGDGSIYPEQAKRVEGSLIKPYIAEGLKA